MLRQLPDLLSDDPAWPLVQTWLEVARNSVEVLPAREPDRADALVATQVTTHSTMGAIVYETGGLLVDDGWIRLLGSGHPRLSRTLPQWNQGRSIVADEQVPAYLLVADDVLGGFFAINGGGLGVSLGDVFYFTPDRLEWEELGRGYTDFVRWCFDGDLEQFYQGYRWPGWEAEVRDLSGDRAFSIWPPLFAEGPRIEQRDRRAVPIDEIFGMYLGGDE